MFQRPAEPMAKSIHSNAHDQLCKALRELRTDAGLTQAALSAKLRRPQSFVSKYENGERRLDVVEFLEVVHALGGNPASVIRKLS